LVDRGVERRERATIADEEERGEEVGEDTVGTEIEEEGVEGCSKSSRRFVCEGESVSPEEEA
jgi:hypothetical protein